jgi:hypothetical protein
MPFKPPIPAHKPPTPEHFSSVIPGYSDAHVLDFFRKHEKPVAYMYRDTESNPTVGVGHLLKGVKDALNLDFVVRRNQEDLAGRPASPDEIKRAYEQLPPQTKKNGGHTADYYDPFGDGKKLTPLFLPQEEIDYHLM